MTERCLPSGVTVGEYSHSSVSVTRVTLRVCRSNLYTSVCGLPHFDETAPRAEVKNSVRPPGAKNGWLSYPGLAEMFSGRPTLSLPPAVSRGARNTSVAGGAVVGWGGAGV